MILNLGCNNNRIPDAIGVDIRPWKNVDVKHDLNVIPYPFEDNSVTIIHAYHILEHLKEPLAVIEELHRILAPGGILYLRVPHFSSMYAWGDITHRQAFSTHAFNIFDSRSKGKVNGYTNKKFDIISKKIRYFYSWPNEKWYLEYVVKPDWPKFTSLILKPLILFMNWLINLSTEIFERFWCYFVGGAAEIYLIMKKVS
jgi:SAM-dependent methyltransferase